MAKASCNGTEDRREGQIASLLPLININDLSPAATDDCKAKRIKMAMPPLAK